MLEEGLTLQPSLHGFTIVMLEEGLKLCNQVEVDSISSISEFLAVFVLKVTKNLMYRCFHRDKEYMKLKGKLALIEGFKKLVFTFS